MTRIVVIGAGGHGQVTCEALLAMASAGAALTVAAFLDDRSELRGRQFLGVPVAGSLAELPQCTHDAVVIAVGDNMRRHELFAALSARGERLFPVVHPRAFVAPDVVIGPGAMITAGAIVNTASKIGANAIINTGATIDHHNTIGNHAHIAPGAHLGGGVSVGDGTLIGIGAAVLPGRSIGAWAVVGAGSVVTRDVPERTTAVGVPARQLHGAARPRS